MSLNNIRNDDERKAVEKTRKRRKQLAKSSTAKTSSSAKSDTDTSSDTENE